MLPFEIGDLVGQSKDLGLGDHGIGILVRIHKRDRSGKPIWEVYWGKLERSVKCYSFELEALE